MRSRKNNELERLGPGFPCQRRIGVLEEHGWVRALARGVVQAHLMTSVFATSNADPDQRHPYPNELCVYEHSISMGRDDLSLPPYTLVRTLSGASRCALEVSNSILSTEKAGEKPGVVRKICLPTPQGSESAVRAIARSLQRSQAMRCSVQAIIGAVERSSSRCVLIRLDDFYAFRRCPLRWHI